MASHNHSRYLETGSRGMRGSRLALAKEWVWGKPRPAYINTRKSNKIKNKYTPFYTWIFPNISFNNICVCITYHMCICLLILHPQFYLYESRVPGWTVSKRELEDNIVKLKHIIRRKLWGKKQRPHKRVLCLQVEWRNLRNLNSSCNNQFVQ